MSQAVRAFWQKAQQDAGLRNKLVAIQEKERQAIVAAVVKLAAEAGFAFTAEEFDAATKAELIRQHAAGELSDQALEALAAGRGTAGCGVGTIESCGNCEPSSLQFCQAPTQQVGCAPAPTLQKSCLWS
jgi:predicted ribosomally synthesized peptide with nif11-like leader